MHVWGLLIAIFITCCWESCRVERSTLLVIIPGEKWPISVEGVVKCVINARVEKGMVGRCSRKAMYNVGLCIGIRNNATRELRGIRWLTFSPHSVECLWGRSSSLDENSQPGDYSTDSPWDRVPAHHCLVPKMSRTPTLRLRAPWKSAECSSTSCRRLGVLTGSLSPREWWMRSRLTTGSFWLRHGSQQRIYKPTLQLDVGLASQLLRNKLCWLAPWPAQFRHRHRERERMVKSNRDLTSLLFVFVYFSQHEQFPIKRDSSIQPQTGLGNMHLLSRLFVLNHTKKHRLLRLQLLIKHVVFKICV